MGSRPGSEILRTSIDNVRNAKELNPSNGPSFSTPLLIVEPVSFFGEDSGVHGHVGTHIPKSTFMHDS